MIFFVLFLDRHYLCNNDNRFVYCDFSKNLKMNVLIGHWGRTSHTICHHGNIDQNGCIKDVTFKIKEVCDGRSWCRVTASNAFFDNHDPCGGNPNYLNFTYECIPPRGKQFVILDLRRCEVSIDETAFYERRRTHIKDKHSL